MSHRVLIIHRQAERRRRLRQALAADGRFEVIGDVADRVGALQLARSCAPHGIVVDLGVRGVVGTPLLDELRTAAPGVRIVVVPGLEADDAVRVGDVELRSFEPLDLRRLAALLADEIDLHAPRPDTLNLPCEAASVGAARSFTRSFCRRTACDDAEEPATLVVSELVGNVVRHAGTGCTLALSLQDGLLRIEVADGMPKAPVPRPSGQDEEGGRGVALIAALSTAWGIDALPDGKVVWADVPLMAESAVG